VQVPTLIDYTKVPRRYRSLLYKLYSWGDGPRVELQWVLRHQREAAADRRCGDSWEDEGPSAPRLGQ